MLPVSSPLTPRQTNRHRPSLPDQLDPYPALQMPPKATTTSSAKPDSVEALLSDLDNLNTNEPSSSSSSSGLPASARSRNTAKTSTTTTKGGGGGGGGGAFTTKVTAEGNENTRQDAQSLLDDLDSLVQRRPLATTAAAPRKPVLANKSTTAIPPPAGPGIASDQASLERGAIAETSPSAQATKALQSIPAPEQQQESVTTALPSASNATTTPAAGGSGWGAWGNVWSSATKLADQARAEIEKRAQSEQAKELSSRGWGLAQGVRGYVKEAGLAKIGEFTRMMSPVNRS